MDSIKTCTEEEKLKIYANRGYFTYGEKGVFNYLPLGVHFNLQSIANVLSLKHIDDMPGYHLEMNTKVELGISVIKDGVKLKFQHSRNELYHCTIQDMNDFYASLPDKDPSILLLSSRKPPYSSIELKKANRIGELQKCMMWSSKTVMIKILKNENIDKSD